MANVTHSRNSVITEDLVSPVKQCEINSLVGRSLVKNSGLQKRKSSEVGHLLVLHIVNPGSIPGIL